MASPRRKAADAPPIAAEAPSAAGSGPRTTREDWLKLALAALVRDGIDRVKVQVIAKTLGVSRSGFYWFFKSTKDLHNQMLEYWLRKNTGPIIEHAMRPADTIAENVLGVFECWVDESLFDPHLDIAVRLWARRSAQVKAIVEQADDQRMDALTAMFRRHGFEAEDAVIRARVIYYAQIGHYTLGITDDLDTRIGYAGTYVRAFSGTDATAEELATFQGFVRGLPKRKA